jgi:hypothetical protein
MYEEDKLVKEIYCPDHVWGNVTLHLNSLQKDVNMRRHG